MFQFFVDFFIFAFQLLACTPDLISIVAKDTGEPIATEEMRYGLRVAVLCIAAPALMRTPQALKYVGPQGFGYSEDEVLYKPFGESRSFEPVGPKQTQGLSKL